MLWHALQFFIRLSHPLTLLSGALLFALGAGIARYLGTGTDWRLYFLGQAWVILLQLAVHYLSEYFSSPPHNNTTSSNTDLPRAALLWASAAALTAVTSFTLMLRVAGAGSAALLIMLLFFASGVFYALPPARLIESGYGELLASVAMAGLIPTLAFTLQFSQIHRLAAMSTFPLIPLHLAMLLTFEFPTYAGDLKHEKRTLLTRLGWQNGMNLHNLMILAAYLLFALALFAGFPTSIGLPALLTLPLGLFQIWYLSRIAAGVKPNWHLLAWTGIAVFAATAYLLTFSFWTK
ncbi:MAG TPA: prenyltransferase [Anaerolineales bacterium]|nr:prenyltransferase [Anaerolineales bacterium]